MVVQTYLDTFTTTDQYMEMPTSNWVDQLGPTCNSSSVIPTYTQNPVRGASNHTNFFGKLSEGYKSNDGIGTNKLPATNSWVTSSSVSDPASSNVKTTTSNHVGLKGKTVPSGNGRVVAVDKVNVNRSKSAFGKVTNDVNGNNLNALTEHNRGPRTNTSNTKLTVKAYSTRAGNSGAQENIVISMDNYNKDNFPVEYVNAKFFVIKSYSEDNVHKSIKYNIWSSTPNGNKKLNSANEEAQKISVGDSKGCHVFLFFSVNASGQFCGVAEIKGHVDFHCCMLKAIMLSLKFR